MQPGLAWSRIDGTFDILWCIKSAHNLCKPSELPHQFGHFPHQPLTWLRYGSTSSRCIRSERCDRRHQASRPLVLRSRNDPLLVRRRSTGSTSRFWQFRGSVCAGAIQFFFLDHGAGMTFFKAIRCAFKWAQRISVASSIDPTS
jgi:hypothetical protein